MGEITLATEIVKCGGRVLPLVMPNIPADGTGLSNPSIINTNGKLYVVLRNMNCVIFHSEKNKFKHHSGPYQFQRINDINVLSSDTYFFELNEDLSVKNYTKLDTADIDPKITTQRHAGLEECRLSYWDNKFYVSATRWNPENGGRMELCEIDITPNSVKAISRFVIPVPDGVISQNCEKNWMPVLDMPFHYIKWSNPTQLVEFNPKDNTCSTKYLSQTTDFPYQLRGGSQVIKIQNYYVAIVHNTYTYNDEHSKFNGNYAHFFIIWDMNWNIVKISNPFKLFNSNIEYICGMCLHKDKLLITAGLQNNVAFLMELPFNKFLEIVNG